MEVTLDGKSLSLNSLRAIAHKQATPIITDDTFKSVGRACTTLDQRLDKGEIIYGVNTGFGKFADTVISKQNLKALQQNLLRSHCCGVGDLLPFPVVRAMLALRINSLVRGYSGVTENTLKTLIQALQKDLIPPVPSQGSVGASGDLCPLAHLALPYTGDADQRLWDPAQEAYGEASDVMKRYNIPPLALQRKEGLALINGTQFITAVTAEALHTAKNAWKHSLLAAAVSFEALLGVTSAYDGRIHELRPHKGQLETASIMRNLLLDSKGNTSELNRNHCQKTQDAYSLRCIPQIYGPFVEVSKLVEQILSTEINSVTDNPLIFPNDNIVLSGGNFHGQYPAKAADLLSIVIPDICNVAERRVARLVDASLSGLPAFLVRKELGGLHCGMMIPAYTAAALCSESKCLAHPSSVDTIPTCANQEDHVSMGGYAAMKSFKSAKNAEVVVAIELLLACQALDLASSAHNHKPSDKVTKVHQLVREHVPFLEEDRNLSDDILKLVQLVQSEKLVAILG